MIAKAQFTAAAPFQQTKVATQRMTLTAGETHVLHCRQQWVRVLVGDAWISINGEDIVLGVGEWARLEAALHPAVISSARFTTDAPLEVELYWEQ